MTREFTTPAEAHDRVRRDRLEQLQVELREARQALTLVKDEALKEHAELEQTLAAEEARVAKANDRLFALRKAERDGKQRRDAMKEKIRKARLERDGPVPQVGLYNEQPDEQDWRVQGAMRLDEKLPAWAIAVIWSLFLGGMVLFLAWGR